MIALTSTMPITATEKNTATVFTSLQLSRACAAPAVHRGLLSSTLRPQHMPAIRMRSVLKSWLSISAGTQDHHITIIIAIFVVATSTAAASI